MPKSQRKQLEKDQMKEEQQREATRRALDEFDRIYNIVQALRHAEQTPEEGWVVPVSKKDRKLVDEYIADEKRDQEIDRKIREEDERKMREEEEEERKMREEEEEETSNLARIYHHQYPEDREMDGFDTWRFLEGL